MIPDDEWLTVASGGPGLEGEAAFNYLKGTVELQLAGRSPWPAPFYVSVADLALQFLNAAESGFPASERKAFVSETDGGLDLQLERIGEHVKMRVPPYSAVEVSIRGYIEGVERFLRRFAIEIKARAPNVLLVDELAALAPWAASGVP